MEEALKVFDRNFAMAKATCNFFGYIHAREYMPKKACTTSCYERACLAGREAVEQRLVGAYKLSPEVREVLWKRVLRTYAMCVQARDKHIPIRIYQSCCDETCSENAEGRYCPMSAYQMDIFEAISWVPR